MSVSVLNGFEYAALVRRCSMDMDIQMDMDMQHGHRHAAWTWTCRMSKSRLHI
jgi:hypothetical protein